MSNKDKVRVWVQALRSGEYQQGHSQLKSLAGDTVRHCCLGVLCELYLQDGQKGEWEHTRFQATDAHNITFYANGLPPSPVQDWIGMAGSDIEIPDSVLRKVLSPETYDRLKTSGAILSTLANTPYTFISRLNDFGCTFSEIADVLEYMFLR